jgi:hypothetical protein
VASAAPLPTCLSVRLSYRYKADRPAVEFDGFGAAASDSPFDAIDLDISRDSTR